jgi:hypothetical protein
VSRLGQLTLLLSVFLASAGAHALDPHSVRVAYGRGLDHLLSLPHGREVLAEMLSRQQAFRTRGLDSRTDIVLAALARLRPHAASLESQLLADLAARLAPADEAVRARKEEQGQARGNTRIEEDIEVAAARIPRTDYDPGLSLAHDLSVRARTQGSRNRVAGYEAVPLDGVSAPQPLSFLPHWWQRFHQAQFVPTGLALSRDGRAVFALAKKPWRILRSDLRTGRALEPMPLPGNGNRLALSPDDKFAIVYTQGSIEGPVWVVNLATGETRDAGEGVQAEFSVDSKTMFVHDSRDRARIWDLASGRSTATFSMGPVLRRPDMKSSSQIAGTADRFRVATRGFEEITVQLHESGASPQETVTDRARVVGTLSPDGRYLVGRNRKPDPRFYVDDLETGRSHRIQVTGRTLDSLNEQTSYRFLDGGDTLAVYGGSEIFVLDFNALRERLR